jgi:hypothetical protein
MTKSIFDPTLCAKHIAQNDPIQIASQDLWPNLPKAQSSYYKDIAGLYNSKTTLRIVVLSTESDEPFCIAVDLKQLPNEYKTSSEMINEYILNENVIFLDIEKCL